MTAAPTPKSPTPAPVGPTRANADAVVRPGWIEVGAAAITYVVCYLITGVVLHRIPAAEHPVANGLAAYGLSALCGLAAFGVAVVIRILKPSLLGLRRVGVRWLWAGAGFGVVAFVLSFIASYLYARYTGDTGNVQTGYVSAATGGTVALIATLLLGAVATPIGEELAFRGVLANALERYGGWVAVLVSAAVFALAHGINTVLPVAFVEGLIAALLFRRTRSIWPGVFVHLVNNSLATLLPVLGAGLNH